MRFLRQLSLLSVSPQGHQPPSGSEAERGWSSLNGFWRRSFPVSFLLDFIESKSLQAHSQLFRKTSEHLPRTGRGMRVEPPSPSHSPAKRPSLHRPLLGQGGGQAGVSTRVCVYGVTPRQAALATSGWTTIFKPATSGKHHEGATGLEAQAESWMSSVSDPFPSGPPTSLTQMPGPVPS